MTTHMTTDTAIDCLQIRRAIQALGFFTSKGENRGPELHCRIWSLEKLSAEQCEQLAAELEAAILPVTKRWADKYGQAVVEGFRVVD